MAVVLLAAAGALCLVVGAGLVFVPAGFLVAGVLLLAAAYVWRYLEVQR